MAKRLTILLVALLALGFAVSGCGDDKEDKAKNDSTTTVTEPTTAPETGGSSAATSVPATPEGTQSVPSTPKAVPATPKGKESALTPEGKQAVEVCRKQTNANPQLSAKAKKKIGQVCLDAAGGDAKGAIKASREACQIIVEDTVPAGPGKQAALDACKRSTKIR